MALDDDSLVTQIMTGEVISVSPDTLVTDAARLMVENAISTLPVLQNGELVGIVTETDIVSREIDFDAPVYGTFLDAVFRWPWDHHSDDELRRITATTVGQLMTHPVYSLRSDATVRDAATLLFERKFTSTPIVDENDVLVGIVSQSDIVKLVAAAGGAEVAGDGE